MTAPARQPRMYEWIVIAEAEFAKRHSDTVVVREDGIEKLMDYPSDLDSLTIPV